MSTRLEKLYARRTDPTVPVTRNLSEAVRKIAESDSVKYVIGAMEPIEPEYTKNTYAQGERVRSQLENRLRIECEYEYQGSVTNDTHIKARSDIDLLAVTKEFFTLEPPQTPAFPYVGNPVDVLQSLRKDAVAVLTAAFPQATVDDKGRRAISLSGGSLTRKIDVVPSNWWNSNKYAETGDKTFRGIQILDRDSKTRVKNTPFLHNALIDIKDRLTSGGLRKAARLMKSVKYDSDCVMSSYDIVAIAYNIDDAALTVASGLELTILHACDVFCRQLVSDDARRASLYVPDGHRLVFGGGGATLDGLTQLAKELNALALEVLRENQRSFTKLVDARIQYPELATR